MKKFSFGDEEKIRMGEDALYLLRILLKAKKTCFVNEQLYYYVQNPLSVTHSNASSERVIEHMSVPDFLTEDELEILNKYLPEQLSSEEVNKIIDEAFNEVNPTGMKDMGKIMGIVNPKLKGKTDMSEVSSIIKSKLS